jgi:hypothetical protein
MTKLFTLRTIFALIMLTVISAQASLLSQQNASPSWFTSVKMTESVLQISDNGIDNMYLIIGKQKA